MEEQQQLMLGQRLTFSFHTFWLNEIYLCLRSTTAGYKSKTMQNRSVFLVIILLISVWCLPASAQRFRASLIGGFNLAQLDGDDLIGFNKIGLNTGAKVAAVLNDRWELSLEMLFAQQGSHRTRDDLFFSLYDDIRLNVVETPVMLSFREWKFHVSTGFSYARLVSYRAISPTGEDLTELEMYRPDLFFWIVGGTYYFRERWGVNVRWSRALTDLELRPGKSLLGRHLSMRLLYAL